MNQLPNGSGGPPAATPHPPPHRPPSGVPPPAPDRAAAQVARQAAADYLERTGLRILDRNWRCADGTLAIVAAEGRALLICEVTARPHAGDGPPPDKAITQARRRRLRRLAVRWLIARGVLFDEVRIDLIAVTRDQPGGFTIEHVRGVA
jgi:putative endonuclease